jgi:hypothetical protein
VLASLLGRDHYLPHQLSNRGDRLVFSNGIVVLALVASLLIVAFNADVTRLIQLYILGGVVFVIVLLTKFVAGAWIVVLAAPLIFARLFEPFQRIAEHGAGVGLGLTVARGSIDAMDGAMVADQTPGGGLTMRAA